MPRNLTRNRTFMNSWIRLLFWNLLDWAVLPPCSALAVRKSTSTISGMCWAAARPIPPRVWTRTSWSPSSTRRRSTTFRPLSSRTTHLGPFPNSFIFCLNLLTKIEAYILLHVIQCDLIINYVYFVSNFWLAGKKWTVSLNRNPFSFIWIMDEFLKLFCLVWT